MSTESLMKTSFKLGIEASKKIRKLLNSKKSIHGKFTIFANDYKDRIKNMHKNEEKALKKILKKYR